MHFSIRYLCRYSYDAPVVDNLNSLRVKPATTGSQRVDEFIVRVEPETRVERHVDYFGTEVLEFGVSRPHEALAVDARARVVTGEAPAPPDEPWEALRTTALREAGAEYLLQQGEAVPRDGVFAELLAQARARSPLAACLLVSELVPDRFEYRQGATYVDSTVGDLLAGGAGVCQDFVHLSLMLLRELGIPARYVSGYLFAADPDGGADSLEVATHAWAEALLPSPGGRGEPVWVGLDPTNRGLTGEQHVKIGHGRHYADVPPIKGVYRGGATADVDATVTMTRLDSQAGARA